MKRLITVCTLALAACALAAPSAKAQTGPICQQFLEDWGDAPECIPAYPTGVLGRFPTCSLPCLPGTQELVPFCPPISLPPGPTGFVRHLTPPSLPHFWLGCFPSPLGGVGGIDSEPDGKTNTPAVGLSACLPGLPTDCVEVAFGGMTFDQDECYTDVTDHGVPGPIAFPTCGTYSLPFMTAACQPVQAFLNICVDWNADGDWNDVLPCIGAGGAGGCAYEWAVKNSPIFLPPLCAAMASPPFLTGPLSGPTWFRISLTLEPVPDDYPWAGSAGIAGGAFQGGETEDYPATIEHPVPTMPSTWGGVKSLYR